ncbi:hypothetical protein LTS08_007567 [Lithohypha guttulata]|uniref:Uncharacterized protein n=1 Tax=Lithohypha guttulata TaxID=1690604 RepID=A0AAN7T760_9EURO|nr:hypothetical protein LTR05_001874 [Lithohypha guttulata]KAK5096311.1 hypothetical protein LTS08_007567 [Lithohypha guttulata]
MSPSIANTMRRFSRGSSQRRSDNSSASNTVNQGQGQGQITGNEAYTPPLGGSGHQTNPNGGAVTSAGGSGFHHDTSRPISVGSNSSFDFMNRPVSGGLASHQPMPNNSVGGLSRTDQVVLRYFWEDKYADNAKRDLHFLKFPFFGQYPSHAELMPYCEIYHLVKTSPGASIVSLGSANGVYIGFELAQGAQLHIDMDDEWRDISHHRIIFKPYESMLRDPTSDATFKTWPKPLTIEFLEDQYQRWVRDLTSFCWIDEPVRELGSAGANGLGGEGILSEKGSRGEL